MFADVVFDKCVVVYVKYMVRWKWLRRCTDMSKKQQELNNLVK